MEPEVEDVMCRTLPGLRVSLCMVMARVAGVFMGKQ
jgi:hypothetical protein